MVTYQCQLNLIYVIVDIATWKEKMCIVHVLIETCTPWLICFKLYPQKRKLHKENGKQEDEKLFIANLVLKDM